MRRAGPVLVAALVLTASAGAATTGLQGVVTRGPTSPVCSAGKPCTAPAKHVKLTFVRGSLRRSATTDDRGHYRIVLPAGSYRVAIAGALAFKPRSTTVVANGVRTQNFAIDTGIR